VHRARHDHDGEGARGGVPIGALLRGRRGETLTPGSHGCTFGGNPFVCAVARAVVGTIGKTAFLHRVTRVGTHTIEELGAITEEFPLLLTEIRGRGLMSASSLQSQKQRRKRSVCSRREGSSEHHRGLRHETPPGAHHRGGHIDRFLRIVSRCSANPFLAHIEGEHRWND